MAQTKKKRKRKHRGTPAGTVERAGRTGGQQTKQDAKAIARQRRAERLERPPTWRGAVNRAAVAAIFGALVLVAFALFGAPVVRNVSAGATLVVLMFLLYVPLGYATDSAFYRFRQRRRG
ncbi:MAG: hypothetical protein M3131_00225 [Actinomycetota bacterium]|nr:hypothetical protein [Actinomycetota bacterium]